MRQEESPEVKRCGDKRCGLCSENNNYLKPGKEFTFAETREEFRPQNTMDCSTSNSIYVITCSGCGENYIGETGDTLRHPMTVHKLQIREPTTKKLGISKHINACAAGIKPNFTVFLFTKFLTNIRKIKE